MNIMKFKSKARLTNVIFLAAMAALVWSGCASLKTISSTPPVKMIVLDKPVEFTFGLVTKLSMPAGEYKPVLEDNYGYYYQAPSPLAARDIVSYVAQGGLIIKRGETKPSKWYAFDDLGGGNGNYIKRGKLPANFPAQTVGN
jgi:hypothetical protein